MMNSQSFKNSEPSLVDAGNINRDDKGYPSNLTESFLRTISSSKAGIHFYSEPKTIYMSYAEWGLNVKKILAGLQKKNLKPKTIILLQIEDQIDLLSTFWACILGGLIPCIVATPNIDEKSNAILEKIIDTWEVLSKPPVIMSADVAQQFHKLQSSLQEMQIINFENLDTSAPSENFHIPQPNDIAFIQLSSGSTGKSKAIPMQHQGLVDCTINCEQQCEMANNQISLNWMPLDHVGGLMVFHIPDIIAGNLNLQVTTEYILHDPLRWLELVEKNKITRTFSPNFAFRVIADALAETDRKFDLSTLRGIMNGGEACTIETIELFLKKTEPHNLSADALILIFGMAEICTVSTANRYQKNTAFQAVLKSSIKDQLQWADANSLKQDITYFANLGNLFPGFKMRIADEQQKTLPQGCVGHLQFSSSRVTPGYLNNDEANKESFFSENGERWFDSGDLGFIKDNQLYVTGRAKELIIIRGKKFPPHEIEELVNSLPGVERGFVAACGVSSEAAGTEGLLVFYVPQKFDADQSSIIENIEKELFIKLHVTPQQVIFIEKHVFPKTTSGKIQRTKLKKLYLEGKITQPEIKKVSVQEDSATSKPSDSQSVNAVLEIFKKDLHKEIDPNRSFYDLGIDSINIATIHTHLQTLVKHKIPIAIFFQYPTVNSLAKYLYPPKTSKIARK